METWVRPNTRILWFAFVLLSLLAITLTAIGLLLPGSGLSLVFRILCWGLAAALILALPIIVMLLRRPRLAFANDHLIVNLRPVESIHVPVEVIECFFFGQGPSLMRESPFKNDSSETSTIVVRLAEAAVDWHEREVAPTLGQWCDGYIIVRGTWSEPITPELMSRINSRLTEKHRESKEKACRQ